MKIYKNESASLKHPVGSDRFIIIGESVSGSSFFSYTVIDTLGGKTYEWERQMCQTFEKKEAMEICEALNNK